MALMHAARGQAGAMPAHANSLVDRVRPGLTDGRNVLTHALYGRAGGEAQSSANHGGDKKAGLHGDVIPST